MKRMDLRNKRGITLIALVITIIVLLILAGITINLTIGEGGIITIAQQAGKNYVQASADEQSDLEDLTDYLNAQKSKIENTKAEVNKKIQIAYATAQTEVKTKMSTNAGYSPIEHIVELAQTVANKINAEVRVEKVPEKVAKADYEKYCVYYQENGNTITIIYGDATFSLNVDEEEIDNLQPNIKARILLTTTSIDYVSGIIAADVKANATTYYGAVVSNYNVKYDNSEGATNLWRIFYSDGINIYLISDGCMLLDNASKSPEGQELVAYRNDYSLNFTNIINDTTYSDGSKWILENSKASKWLSKYLSVMPSSGDNKNMRAVAYMLDTSRWSQFVTDNAEYAIGGATIEMFCASYKDTHSTQYLEYKVEERNKYGYQVAWNIDGTIGSYQDGFDRVEREYSNIYNRGRKRC
jgi:hypothetical protein